MKHISDISLLLAAAVLLQGCGTAASKPTAAPEPEIAAVTEEVPAPAEPPVTDLRPELVRVITDRPSGMDAACYAEVYETLYEEQNGEIIPLLASGAWQHTPGEEIYLVPLVAAVTDSEGNPFTAADAAYCYEQAREPLLSAAQITESGELLLSFRRELEADEERRIFCGIPLYTAIGDKLNEADTLQYYGTGPYRIADQGESSLSLLPNEHYHGSAEAAQRVKEIEYLFLTDAPERVIALEVGKAEMADCLSYDEAEDFLPGGSYSDLFTTIDYYSAVGRYLLPNVSKYSALSSEALRLAIFSLLDCEALAEKTGGRACQGLGNPDFGELNTVSCSYQNTVPDTESGYEALRDTGYHQENLILVCPESGEGRLMAESIQLLWEKVGVSVVLKGVSAGEYEAVLADLTGWDLALVETAAGHSVALQWQELWALEENSTTLRGGQTDATLLNLLQTVSVSETATEENFRRAQERVYNHGFALALPQLCEPRVVSAKVKTVVMNHMGALLPGESEYEKGESDG